MINPNVNPTVPIFAFGPSLISGTSSDVTTYIIAPAAYDNKYGNIGTTISVKRTVIIAPIGSTIPDNTF